MTTQAQHWNDWMLRLGILCFILAPLTSLTLLWGIEQPMLKELQDTFNPAHENEARHFFPVGIVSIFRQAATYAAWGLGLTCTLIGNLKMPEDSPVTQRLAKAAWATCLLTFLAGLAIALLA